MKDYELIGYFLILVLIAIIIIPLINKIIKSHQRKALRQLTSEVLESLGLDNWLYNNFDDVIEMKSSRTVDDYNTVKYFKDKRDKIDEAIKRLNAKAEYATHLRDFLSNNDFTERSMYYELESSILIC